MYELARWKLHSMYSTKWIVFGCRRCSHGDQMSGCTETSLAYQSRWSSNEQRYQKCLRHVRYSLRELSYPTANTSEDRVSERLYGSNDTLLMERIAKDTVDQEKRVLISSSENAIRGLLTHLCDIPESEITGIEIPNV
jgi:bisphosphoglycerate-dependent phosphoglycerate mutase